MDDRLATFLNLAQYRICRINDFEELAVRISGAMTIGGETTLIPQTGQEGRKLREVKNVVMNTGDGQSRKLTRLTYQKFDEKFPDPDFNGLLRPTYYIVEPEKDDASFEWFAVPDLAYTFKTRLTFWPKKVGTGDNELGDAQELDIPWVDDLVLNLAVSIAYQSLAREDKAMEYFRIYAAQSKEVKDLKTEDYDTTIAGVIVGADKAYPGEYWNNAWVTGVR